MPSITNINNDTNILIELNTGFKSILLYVCTIKAQTHELAISKEGL